MTYERLLTNIRLNGQSESTLRNYGRSLAKFALYFKACPTSLPDEKTNEYLLLLRDNQQPSFSYFKHTVYGLRLAYRLIGREDKAIRLPSIKRVKSLPLVLNRSEIRLLIRTPKWKKHRILIALTNHRIKNITEQEVAFEYKDYKDGAKKKLMSLKGEEFLRRFCLHILPKGLRKVRKYGLVSKASKKSDIPKARAALGFRLALAISSRKERKAKALERLFGKEVDRCPCCQKGKMKAVSILPPQRAPPIKVQKAHP